MSLAKIVVIIINAETKIMDMKKRMFDNHLLQVLTEKEIKCQAYDELKTFLMEE